MVLDVESEMEVSVLQESSQVVESHNYQPSWTQPLYARIMTFPYAQMVETKTQETCARL